MNATTDTLNIEIESSTTKATSGINRLVKSLEKLNTALSGTNNMSKLQTLAISLRPLETVGSGKGLSSLIRQLNKLPQIVNNLDSSTLDQFASKILKLTNAMKPLATEMEKVSAGFSVLPSGVKKVSTSMNQASKNTSSFTKRMSDSVALGIAKLQLLIQGIPRLMHAIGGYVQKSAEYNEALNLFTVSMGEYAEKATEFTNRFSSVLGVDPAQLMQYMGSFNSLVKGLGVGSDAAYTMSKNMTQLAYDLASFRNIGIEEAFLKIQSGISGEIEPLRNVGIALSQATLQELAYSLGIQKRVADMTEAEKAELRYYQIMKSTTMMQGDMGRTLLQPANALRVMQQQFVQLARAIGNIFIPIVMKILPYLQALTELATAAAQAIANLLGYEKPEVDYSSLQKGIKIAQGGLDGVTDSAGKAAKAVSEILAPFDKLNVVSQPKSTGSGSGSGGVSGGGGLGLDLPDYDALAGAQVKNLDKIKKKLTEILKIIGLIGLGIASYKVTKGVLNFFDLLKNNKNFKIAVGVALTVTGIVMATDAILKMLEGDTSWATISQGIAGALGAAGGVFTLTGSGLLALGIAAVVLTAEALVSLKNLSDTMKPYIDEMGGLWETWKKGMGVIFDWIGDKWKQGMDVIKGWITNKFLDLLYWINNSFCQPIIGFFTGMWNGINNGINWVVTMWTTGWSVITGWVNNTIIQPISNFFSGLWNSILNGISGVWNTITSVFGRIASWVYNNVVAPIKNFFVSAFSSIGDTASSIIKGAINGVLGLTERIVNTVVGGINAALSVINAIPGVNIKKMSKVKFDRYEDGGFPTKGQFFIANEAGPEFIGNIGNRSAVANNDQIIEGIYRGVYEATLEANRQRTSSPNYTTVYLGNDKIYSGFGQRVNSENDRYGKTVIKV